ncbi:OsmC family protein [Hufsiella ginkgonis]|uniref:OsmC family peroxiredoxin n=1 Tax=Hufsiella ginkgonis TaxID=2695274 RepID=A0A7K1XXA9_9SPHI|nr:OsmC family protein [Hufsiella ginkgonis]MXV15359.1 OsmC family peroxiredoxin [Hufsiella ginkgonis]
MNKEHRYQLIMKWTGNTGSGTAGYQGYDRCYTIYSEDKAVIYGSSDAAFRGDKSKYNPEELLVASLSSCHMLWYLHLCAESGIIVTDYIDHAKGVMVETANGGGRFKEVILNPVVTVKTVDMIDRAARLHHQANALCFIANSVNFPVIHKSQIKQSQ